MRDFEAAAKKPVHALPEEATAAPQVAGRAIYELRGAVGAGGTRDGGTSWRHSGTLCRVRLGYRPGRLYLAEQFRDGKISERDFKPPTRGNFDLTWHSDCLEFR